MVSFTVTPLTDHTGAEVLGLDTNSDLGAPSLRPLPMQHRERRASSSVKPCGSKGGTAFSGSCTHAAT
jgi:hypothetical protein